MHAKASREHAATGPGNRFLIHCKKRQKGGRQAGWGSSRVPMVAWEAPSRHCIPCTMVCGAGGAPAPSSAPSACCPLQLQLSGGLRPPPRFASLGRLLRAPWPSLVCARVQPALARSAAVWLASAAGRWQCWRQRQRHAHWLQLHRFCCLFQASACVQCVYSLQTMAGQLTVAGQVGRGGRRRGWQQCRRLRHRPAAASGSGMQCLQV